jgi:hypothetical protein
MACCKYTLQESNNNNNNKKRIDSNDNIMITHTEYKKFIFVIVSLIHALSQVGYLLPDYKSNGKSWAVEHLLQTRHVL